MALCATSIAETDGSLCSSPVLPKQPQARPPDSDALLLYFANAVLPRFQLREIAVLIDPRQILEDEPLKQAVLAVSQAHFEHCAPDSTSTQLTTRRDARNIAIQSLRQRLSAGVADSNHARALFVVNVLLCMLDGMIDPSQEQPDASIWHLKGGYAMLDRWGCITTDLLASRGLPAHLLSVFATMDLVHALLSGVKPYFDPLLWHMFAGTQAWWGTLPPDDTFLAVLKTLSELATLGQLVRRHLPSIGAARLAERCLPAISNDTLLDRVTITDKDAQNDEQWSAFCRLYEISCDIYVNRAIRLRSIAHPEVQAATRNGVGMLVDVVLPDMLAHCIILPLLIIGAHAIHSQDRKVILQVLAPSVSFLAFGNLQSMAEWLKSFWRQSAAEVTWWEQFAAISDNVFLF